MERKDIRTRSGKGDYLQSLVSSGSLTQDGKDWLVTALDPFHDYSHVIAGYPDADVSKTVTMCYQYQTEVKVPVGVVGNWDAHIFTTPVMSTDLYSMMSEAADWKIQIQSTPLVQAPVGPLVIYTTPAGGSLFPTIPVTANTATATLPAGNAEEIYTGTSRVISMGFEVHNTTSSLHKQGSVTTYRMPQAASTHQCLFTSSGGASYGAVVGPRYSMPPTNLDEANKMRDTRTWAAEDGVYANCFQSGVTNPLKPCSNQYISLCQRGDPGVAGNALATPVQLTASANATPYPTKTAPYDTTGAMFVGLSNETVLTVKLRIYVEHAPTWQQPALAPLATPSAGYDVNALMLYAQAINMLPPAVKVGENDAGDWWRSAVQVLRHVAQPIGLLANTFLPGAGLVGSAVSSLASGVDTRRSISKQAAAAASASRPPARQAKQKQQQQQRRRPAK